MGGESDLTSRWTIPNALCILRLSGCAVLLYLAFNGWARAFLYVFGFLALTDWIDGKLARRLHQRSPFGAQLDTFADITMYGCLLLSAWWLVPEAVESEWPWVAMALLAYAASVVTCEVRFGRWPAYHTRSAKACWFLILLGVVCLFADLSLWPLRVALLAVSLASLEAVAITLLLPEWRTDVSSVFQVPALEE